VPFSHFDQPEHVPRADLAGLINQDAALTELLHFFIFQECGDGVRIGKSPLPRQHFP